MLSRMTHYLDTIHNFSFFFCEMDALVNDKA
uniref:Uncharacterized protein n=1 Tax=Arundo donax TaxID=35708 RepID=A0A0A9BK41_ARUDO